MPALRELLTLCVRTRAFGPRLGKRYLLNYLFYNKYTSYAVDNIIVRISVLDYPCITVKPRFCDNIEIFLPFGRKQQQIFTTCCYPITLYNLETTFLGQF